MVSYTQLAEDVFLEFYNMLNNNLTDPKGRTKWISSAFPDTDIESKDDLPWIVIEPVVFSERPFTLNSKRIVGSVKISVYSSSKKEADQLFDQILSVLNEKKTVLAEHGLRMVNIVDSDYDTVFLDKIKVRVREMVVQFIFYAENVGVGW